MTPEDEKKYAQEQATVAWQRCQALEKQIRKMDGDIEGLKLAIFVLLLIVGILLICCGDKYDHSWLRWLGMAIVAATVIYGFKGHGWVEKPSPKLSTKDENPEKPVNN